MDYKLRGYALTTTLIAVIFWIALFGAGAVAGKNIIDNIKTEKIVEECKVLDRALQTYSSKHKAVKAGSVKMVKDKDDNDKMVYEEIRTYPKSLEELNSLRDEQGHFVKTIDLSKFTYKVQKNDNVETYTLEVKLPNGKIYTSEQSDKKL